MALYNSRGNLSVSTDSGWGMFTADGKLRVTIVSGTTRTGLYAANGGYNVVITQATDSNTGLYHPCGALRVVESTSNTGVYAPNGAFFVSGAAYSAYLLGSDTDGLALASRDDTMTIRSTSDSSDNYQGVPNSKLTTTRASTATYWNSSGLLASVATNTLRRDFDPRLSSTVERCGYLIEEARTNLVTQSNALTNAAWTATRSSVAATETGMDGTTSAFFLKEDATAASSHYLYNFNAIAITASTNYCLSAIVKQKTGTRSVRISADNAAFTSGFYGTFNFASPANPATGIYGTATVVSSGYQDLGNGYYRIWIVGTLPTTTANVGVYMHNGTGVSYDGDNTSGFSVERFQFELGSFPSSYIPTAGSAVTRAADAVSLATSLFPYSQSAGACYAKVALLETSGAATRGVIATDLNGRILSFNTGSAAPRMSDGTNIVTAGNGLTAPTAGKIASSYGAVNGQMIVCNAGTVATGSFDGTHGDGGGTMRFGALQSTSNFLNGWILELLFLPNELSAAQLQDITT